MKPYAYKIQKSRFYHISYLTYTLLIFLRFPSLRNPPKNPLQRRNTRPSNKVSKTQKSCKTHNPWLNAICTKELSKNIHKENIIFKLTYSYIPCQQTLSDLINRKSKIIYWIWVRIRSLPLARKVLWRSKSETKLFNTLVQYSLN